MTAAILVSVFMTLAAAATPILLAALGSSSPRSPASSISVSRA